MVRIDCYRVMRGDGSRRRKSSACKVKVFRPGGVRTLARHYRELNIQRDGSGAGSSLEAESLINFNQRWLGMNKAHRVST